MFMSRSISMTYFQKYQLTAKEITTTSRIRITNAMATIRATSGQLATSQGRMSVTLRHHYQKLRHMRWVVRGACFFDQHGIGQHLDYL